MHAMLGWGDHSGTTFLSSTQTRFENITAAMPIVVTALQKNGLDIKNTQHLRLTELLIASVLTTVVPAGGILPAALPVADAFPAGGAFSDGCAEGSTGSKRRR